MKREVHDDVFGLLQQEKDYPWWYRATVDFLPGIQIDLLLSLDDSVDQKEITDNDVDSMVDDAKKLYAALQREEVNIRRSVANEQFPIYNEDWAQTSDDKLTMEEFLDEMTLNSISIRFDGESTMSYTVGERFTDHILIAYINNQFEVTYVEFAG